MKFYKMSDNWYIASSPDNTELSIYLKSSEDGSRILGSIIPQAPGSVFFHGGFGPKIGQEISKQEFISIYNQIKSSYENYFETKEGN